MPWVGVVHARGSHSRDSELGFYGSHMFLQHRGGRGKHKNSLQQLLPCVCPPYLHPKTLPPPSLQPGEGAGRGSGFRGAIWGWRVLGAKANNVSEGRPPAQGPPMEPPHPCHGFLSSSAVVEGWESRLSRESAAPSVGYP